MNKLLISMSLLLVSHSALALPPDGMTYDLKSTVVKVRVFLKNGNYSVGSGVVVAKDQVVTSCHVIANASAINVVKFGDSYSASSIKADWHHDLCILHFDGLDTKIATLGSSTNLSYEQPVFTISFPNNSPKPLATYGFVKALYPMDDSVIIRTTSDFRLGASGGAMFDNHGKLVGIITLKSPGRNAYYYNMPVEWITALLDKPTLDISTASEPPFWDAPEEHRPFFMRVVQPYQTKDWPALLNIATQWCEKEPKTIEAWHYRALAEYHLNDTPNAIKHFNKVFMQNNHHTNAIYYLGLIATNMGNREEALKKIALLDVLDAEAASVVRNKLDHIN